MDGDSYSRGESSSSANSYASANGEATGHRQGGGRDYGARDDRRDRDRTDRGDRGDRDRDRDRQRRRSRSPGHRSQRQDNGDSYSSSRGYREREREDRYAGRDRRGGDRDWDRDRGAYGRDRRDPPQCSSRDGFDDRRGDRRGGGRRDDGFPARQLAPRSPSPHKPKEPTPDLTDVVSILERKRRLTQFDIKPARFENMTAEQAKLSGLFPLPGAPRQSQIDQTRLDAFLQAPGNSASRTALDPSTSRQAKRMFVTNIPHGATDESVLEFFNLHMSGLNVINESEPCVSVHVSKDKKFAVLEFKNAEVATFSLALDGLEMDGSQVNGANGDSNPLESGLQISRPKDYITPAAGADSRDTDGQVANTVRDGPWKFCVTRMPVFIDEAQAKELIAAFGELKSFVLVRDTSSGESRGVAFGEYKDAATITDVAIAALNGMELGESKLKVFKACVGAHQATTEFNVAAMSSLAGARSDSTAGSRVLCLHNMVSQGELFDDDDYEEIVEDVKDECSKYGTVLSIKMPRPTDGPKQANGVGKIYVKYESSEGAAAAFKALAGRKFAERTVVTSLYAEDSYDAEAW